MGYSSVTLDVTIGLCQSRRDARTVTAMDTRMLGYVGLGVLVGIVVATLIGIPPVIWIAVALVALVGSVVMMVAQSDGANDAARMLARETATPTPEPEASAPLTTRTSDVEVELVRPADATQDVTAVWLHRRGGRRVHRYETAAGWVVERVSTKDTGRSPEAHHRRHIDVPY